ncbi:MAG: PIN domain-containing protein [Ramlibacter sp.]|nr:PIN domain-containing protein [Ramlibacter sp.]
MIIDSSAWIEFLRSTGSAVDLRVRRALRRREPLRMPDVVYQEVLQGAASATHFIRMQQHLDQVPAFVPDDSRELARQAALLYARCRWQGITPRSSNDCLIASCAVEANEPLLHSDRDFELIARVEPNLRFA